MNNFLLQKILLVHNNAFYEKKFLIILCLISTLHVLLVMWMIYSFNKIIPSLNHSSTLGGAAIQVRLLSTPIQASATAMELNFKTPNSVSQPVPKLIASTNGGEVITQKKTQQQSQIKNETLTKENQPSRSQIIESNQHLNLKTTNQESLKINDVQEKPTSISRVSSTTHYQSANNSSQQINTTSTELVEKTKTKTKTSDFKALNRRLNYPNRARSLGVEGRIRVQFDITSSGTISNIQVLSETPAGVFTDSVLKDMARWRYQTTGEVKNQIVSIVFKLDGRVVLDN